MNIALPILLLVFGALTLWILTESSLRWYFKAASISTFCIFTVIFWSSIHSFLGWPANEGDIPEKVLIHWVIIKEPNKFTKFEGGIYVLLESVEKRDGNRFLEFFQYNKDRVEPRLYGLSYSRDLHEQLEKGVMPRLKSGQPVVGKLTKIGGEKGKGKGGDGKGSDKQGGGSESQDQEWHFHELRPSDFLNKPTR